MDAELVAALLSVLVALVVGLASGFVALLAGVLAVYGQIRSTRLGAEFEDLRLAEQRRIEAEKATSRYREPLGRAAYDLQSRLYNILEQELIGAYLIAGNKREQDYVVNNTVFLIAQYFAWTEIIRRDIQFIDLGADEQTRELAHLQDDIYALFSTDRYPAWLRIFAGEQRAIGEQMLQPRAQGLECVGYSTFLRNLEESPDALVEAIRDDVRSLSTRLDDARPRLIGLQNALIDLLAFLDPQFIRFPRDRRSRVSASRG